jgi:hypothetical protein
MLHDQQDNSSRANIRMHENPLRLAYMYGRTKKTRRNQRRYTYIADSIQRSFAKGEAKSHDSRQIDPGLSYITRQNPSLFSLIPDLSPAFFSAFLFLCSSAFRLSLAKNSSCLRASTSSSVLCITDSSFGSDCSLFSRCRIFWYSLSMRLLSLSSAWRDLKACDECLSK